MCGIAGFCFTADSCLNARSVARALLCEIESRGTDATGYAAFSPDGTIDSHSAAMPARAFTASRREYRLAEAARTVVLHTRLATQGHYSNPLNNHPVLAYAPGGECIACVHNGSVLNDDEIFRDHALPRYGQVDTEAIPALLANLPAGDAATAFAALEGAIATAWLDERTVDTLHLARGWSSPLQVAKVEATDSLGIRIAGVIFASTTAAIAAALAVLGLSTDSPGVNWYTIGEGEYAVVTDGRWNATVYPFSPASYSYPVATTPRSYWWDDTPSATGIGSGRVPTGKPSTEDDYISWWAEQDYMSRLADTADLISDPGYLPKPGEIRLLADSTPEERQVAGIDATTWRRIGQQGHWHLEACRPGDCEWNDPECPRSVDRLDHDAMTRALKRWGTAVVL